MRRGIWNYHSFLEYFPLLCLNQSPSISSAGCGLSLIAFSLMQAGELTWSINCHQKVASWYRENKSLPISNYSCLIKLICLSLRNSSLSLHHFQLHHYRWIRDVDNLPTRTNTVNLKAHKMETKSKNDILLLVHSLLLRYHKAYSLRSAK